MLSRRRTFTLLVVLCLGHVLLISAQVQSGRGRSVLHATAFGAMAGVQGGTAAVAGGVNRLWHGYFWLVGKSRENDALRSRVLALEGELQAERARAARAAALEEALEMQQSIVPPSLAARVIAGTPVPGALNVTINRGTADGVRENFAVINGRGVVGRVIGQPTSNASLVQLLAGKSAAAGAVIEKSGAAGLVAGGFADGDLRLDLVSSVADIAPGDRIVTSGQDGIYPAGFLIGHVAAVKGTGKGREITVTPSVDFSHIDIVLVILARPPQGMDAGK